MRLATFAGTSSPLRTGALASSSLHLVGLRLTAPTSRIDVPKDAPFSVPVGVWIGDHQATPTESASLVPAGAVLTATLTGPGIPSPLTVSGNLATGLSLPGLAAEGDFTLSNIRLVKDGVTVVEADPKTVNIHCLGEIIISSVTSTPMTMQELRDAGVQLQPGNYEGRRFTMALAIGSQQVSLTVPVAVPVYNGLEDPRGGGGEVGRLEITGFTDRLGLPDLSVVVADITPEKDPFSLSRPAISHVLQHNFKALIVIPGSIGYLHQFYKANLVVFNALKEGSPFQITHLSATLNLPPGGDGAVGTLDDPLRLAQRDGETDAVTKPVRGPGADGTAGTGDPVLMAGQSGTATFFVEAMKEGAHQLNFDIRGQFEGGGLSEPVPLLGHAQGKLLVRNPNFSMVLVHPDVVRRGEEYILETRLTNTSMTLANGVTVTLDRSRLGSVKLVEDLNTPVDTLNPGETAVFKFKLRALRNGEVRSSYLYMEQGTIGFQLSTGLGERNIRLNPDTLVLPQTLEGRNGLPLPLREAMLRVLGQAYSVASTKGALPPGVLPIAMSSVTGQMSQDLSEQGLFIKMGIDKARVWMRLWEMFIQNPDMGFDQLVRTTDAGRELREAFMNAWTWADPSRPMPERLGEMIGWNNAFGAMSAAVVEGARPGLRVELQDAMGNRIVSGDVIAKDLPYLPQSHAAWGGTESRHWISMPSPTPWARLTLVNRSLEAQSLRLATAVPVIGGAPSNNYFELELAAGQSAVITLGEVREGAAILLAPDGAPLGSVYSTQTSDLHVEPFKVLAVHRYDIELDPLATPYGTHVMMLFNRPIMALNLPSGDEGFNAAKALVQVDANAPWKKVMPPNPDSGEVPPPPPALFKASARAASLYLERPVGPYVPRQLTLASTWTDAEKNLLTGDLSWPILCGDVPGGALVRGKVRKANGSGLPAKMTYWYQAASQAGNVDLATGYTFLDEEVLTHYALVSNFDTEADGSYQLDYVPEPVSFAVGPMLLKGATNEGTAWAQASVLGNGQLIEMDLVLEGKGSVDGYVLNAAGAPMAGAQVQVIQEQPTNPLTQGTGGGTFAQSTMTDANGHYRVDNLKTGVFSIRALKDLFGAAASNEISRDGETVHQNVVLESPTGTLKVRLLDTSGQVVLTQIIRLGIASGLLRSGSSAATLVWPEQATPSADGWVTFSNVPAGDVGLMVPSLPLGTVSDWRGFLDPGTAQEITLKMLPPAEQAFAHFLVVDAAGNPVPGVYLSESPRATDPSFAITDENGMAPKRPVRSGPSFLIYAYHPAWPGTTQSESVTVQPGEDRLVRTIMRPRGTVRGTVKYPDGTPVKGAYVAIPPVFDDMKRNRLAITDATGAFLLPNVQVGSPFRLVAVGPELRTAMAPMNLQVAEGQNLDLNLALPFVGKNQVSGVIYQPLEGTQKIPTMAQVWVDGLLPDIAPSNYGNGSWGLLRLETTGAASTGVEGNYTFTGLPQGTYTLHANSDLFPVEVKSGGDFAGKVDDAQIRDIYLSSSFAGELKGVIYKRDGQTPVAPDVRVRLIGGTIGELIIFTTDAGKYHFPKVIPEGCYKLRVEDPASGDITVASVEMKKESSQVKNLRLWGKGTLTVKVQDSFGQILPEGVVTLSHSKGGSLGCPAVATLDTDDLPLLAQRLKPEMGGLLIFEDLLEGAISVGLKNPTGLQGMTSVSIPEGGGNAEVVVRLQPVGDVLGTLYRADGSLASAGRVDAYQGSRWLGVSPTRMDGVNGRFRFQVLPTGPISLEAWDPDSRQMGKGVVNVVAGQTAEVTITTHDKGPVVVTVTQEGQAVIGAAIRLAYRGGDALDFSTESTSDADGKATFYVPPGDYTATATDPLSLATGSVAFSRGVDQGEIQTSITLQAVRSLWATAVPPPGAPVGFSLEGWSLRDRAMGRLVNLDAKGQGMLRDLPVGSRNLTLTDLRGRWRGDFTITLTVEGGAVQTPAAPIQAIAYGNLEVTVVDAHSQLASNVAVSASSGGTIYTDGSGLARFFDLMAGNLDIRAAGASGAALLQLEDQTAHAQLQLPPTASVHGTVFDPLGQPIPYVLVSAGALQTATDGQGQFRVPGLGLGTYTVTALSSSGRRAAVSVTLDRVDQDAEVRLDFPPQGSLTGTVKDPLRAVPPPIHVMVYLALGGNPVGDTFTDAQGAFRFSFLPAGKDLRVVGILDDGHTQVFSQNFSLAPLEGATQNLDLTMPVLVNVKGWTLDALGNKIPMTVLLLDDQGRTIDKAVTTGDIFDPDHPTFFFRYLLAGHRYRLMGLQETTGLAIAYLDYTPAGDKELDELTLQAQARRGVKVQARYPDGTPTPGPGHFVITSQSLLGGHWEGSLGSDGSALIQDLPEGPATVSLTGLPNQPVLSTTFVIPAQSTAYDVAVPAVGLGSLVVKVQTTSGRLLTGGTLTAQGAGSPRWTGVAQVDGTYRLDGVWIGTPLSLQATGFGLVGNAPPVTLTQHGQQLTLVYPAPDQGSLSGVVRDSRGTPVAGAMVSTAGRTTATDAAGAYQLLNLSLGSYGLVVTLPNRVDRGLGAGTLASDGQTLAVDVALKGTGTVAVRATKADGTTPLVGSPITLTNISSWTDGRTLSAPTDINGIATFLTVLEGDLRASGSLLGSSQSATGNLQADGSLTLSLKALPVAVSLAPTATTVLRNHAQAFTANVTNAENRAVTWSVQEGAAGGSITADGRYTAPAVVGTYHVVATSVEDPTKQAQATVTVPSVTIGISPASAGVLTGYTKQFIATVGNADNLSVTWSIQEGAAGGTVSAVGLYTAPSIAGTYHVVATSLDDPTKQSVATVTVTVPPPVVVSITPSTATLLPNGVITLTSTVTGSTNTQVDWSIQEGVAGGTVNGGIYTAPATPGTYHVVATSQANPAKSATATVTVQSPAPVSISVSPATLTLGPGAIGSLKATVTGTTQQAVTWAVQEGAAGGTINSAGFYTAPFAAGAYHVVATSAADPTKTATVLVVVSSTPPALDLSGVYATNQGTLKLFPAGSSWYGQWINGSVAMEIHGTFAGQVLSGAWTSPAQADQGQFAVTFSQDGATFSGSYGRGSAQLGTVWTGTRQVGQVAIYLTPSSATLKTSQQLLLTALVTSSDTRVQWTADGGSVDATGLYTAPAKGSAYHITATSMADPTQQAVCTVDVSSDGQLDVTGSYQTNNGMLKLYKSGSQILGDWTNASNVPIQVKGSLVGSVLSGSWTAPSTADQGQFVITFAADASTFTGTWGRNTDQLGNVWTGTRQAGVSVKLLPTSVDLQTGTTFSFQALVAGTQDTAIDWSVQEAAGGSVDGNGLYYAPLTAGVFHVVATSVADPTKSAMCIVSVTPDGQVDITGTYQTNNGTLRLYKSGTQILGDWTSASNAQIQVKGSLVGTVLSGGWVSPSTADLGQFVLTFSADGSSFSGSWGRNMDQLGNTWTGSRQAGVSVKVLPGTATLRTGAAQAYSALVAGTTTTAVTWAVQEAGGGSIDANGQYTAPAIAGTFHVTATSTADSTKSATSTVVVTTDAVLEVSGTYGSYSSTYGTTGDLTLFQAGSAITGTWGHPQGNSSVSGTLTSRVFSGSWKRLDGGNSGLFVVTFAVDGQSYSGTWGYGTSNLGYTWTGTRKAGVSIQINPGSSVLAPGDTQNFTASVAGDFDKSVTWASTGGTINAQGVYAAPSTPGVYSVTATANADSTKSATSTVVVTTDALLEVSGTYGSYSSTYGTTGDLTLFQAGSAITGTWGHPQGNSSVSGTLTGRVFSGTWKRLDGGNSGLFVVTFAVDGLSYSGTWGYGTSNSSYTWTGTRKAGLSIQINPGSSVLTPGDTQNFTALVAGDFDKSITWTTTGGTINAQGVYAAPSTPGVYTVTATANADSIKSASATVVVTTDAVLEVSGTYGSYSSAYGMTGDLTLFQAGSAITGTWGHPQGSSSVSGTLAGRVLTGNWKRLDGGNSGLFVVTFAVDGLSYSGTWGYGTSNSSYTWTGTRKAGVSIQINPGSSVLTPGDTQNFTASVAGDFDKSITWTTTGGTINAQGVYAAPSTPGVYTVTATANADSTKSASATVVVTTDAVLEVSGTYGSYSSAYGTTGDLTLFQAGSAITGTWGHPQGSSSVSGTLTGRVFSGTWNRLDGGSSGLFVVTFAVDGLSYSGTWGYGTSNSSYTWTGTRKAGVVTVSVIPDTQPIIGPGDTQPFQALVGGIFDKRVTWSASAGTISADGRFTAPNLPGQNRYTVTATSTADPTKLGTANVLVAPGGVAFVSGKYTVPYGTAVFYQTGPAITGDIDMSYYGSFSFQGTLDGYVLSGKTTNKANGAIQDLNVTFAPNVNSFTGSTSFYGSGWNGARQLGVVVIKMSPLVAKIIHPTEQVQYTAEVAGSLDKSITWTATTGSVDGTGLYTAPSDAAYSMQTITATANADPTKKLSAPVTITPSGYLFISGKYMVPYGTAVFYQTGPAITGDIDMSYYGSFSFQGTLDGYVLSGKTTNKANGAIQDLNVTFAPNVNSFTGSTSFYGSGWNGTRQLGVVVIKMSPLAAKIIHPAEQVQYTAEVAGSLDKSITWTATTGSVDGTGLYTAPSDAAYSMQTITATANADPTKKLSAPVTITPTGYLFISGKYTVPYGTAVFYQTGTAITGDIDMSYYGSFSFQGTLDGYVLSGKTINKANGAIQDLNITFTPDVNSFTGSTSFYGSGWNGTRQPGVVIKLVASVTSMSVTDSTQFSADVAGTLDKRVNFTATSGSMTTDGLFTPISAGAVTITAKSFADPTKTATAKVLVTDGNPATSLVARWKFEEGGGTTALDASTNVLHGTLYNNPAWIEGRVGQGQALQFNGFTSYMEVPNNTKLNPQSISLALWIFLPADPNCGNNGNWRSLLHKGSVYGTASAYDVVLEVNHTIAWDTGTGSSDRWWPAGVTVPIGRWTHLVLTYDAGTGLKQAFQDGILKDSKVLTPAPLTANTNSLIINNAASSACSAGYGHFDGAMDDLRVYNRTLSPSEVASLFAPVSLSPAYLSVTPNASVAFAAFRPDGLGAPITWGASGGSIGTDGTFVAPVFPGTYTVTATSSLDPVKPAVATVDVRDFDAADAFTSASNPNGAWSYGWTGTLGSGFTPFANHPVRTDDLDDWDSWPTASILHNSTLKNITVSGSNVVLVPNQLSMHPGSGGQYSVLRWTASEAGSMEVRASFMGLDPAPTTTDIHVLLNGVSKFDGTVNAYHKGPSFQGVLDVQPGDTIDVAVGFGNGTYSYDSTGVQFRINKATPALSVNPSSVLLAPGASKAFTVSALGLADSNVTWSVEEGSFGGTISPDGTYTAPDLPGVYHVVATSTANPSMSAKATVVVASTSAALLLEGESFGLPMLVSTAPFEHPVIVLARR